MPSPHAEQRSDAQRATPPAPKVAPRPADDPHGDDLNLSRRDAARSVCPVSRLPINDGGDADAHTGIAVSAAAVGGCTGNAAAPKAAAPHADATLNFHTALTCARQAGQSPDGRCGQLGAAAWWRLAVMLSFTTRLPHAQAAALPLAVMPPPGMRPTNPVQALQWLLTRELSRTDGCASLRVLGQSLGDTPLAHDYYRFVAALLPRLIEARRLDDTLARKRATEDAWLQPLVQRLWQRLALQLDARRTRTLLRHAVHHGIGAVTKTAPEATRDRPIATPRRTPSQRPAQDDPSTRASARQRSASLNAALTLRGNGATRNHRDAMAPVG